MRIPLIDWKTDFAGGIAAVSIFTALHVMFGVMPENWTTLAWVAFISGPVWAQMTLTAFFLRERSWRVFRLTPNRVRDALLMTLITPLGVIGITPLPWVGFWIWESMSPQIGWPLLVFLAVLFVLVWVALLAPIQKTTPVRSSRVVRMIILGLSMAFGVFPALTLFFTGVFGV